MSDINIKYLNLFRDASLKRLNLTEKDWVKAVNLFGLYNQAMSSIYQNKWKARFKNFKTDLELSIAYMPYIEALLGHNEADLVKVIQCIKHDRKFAVFPPNPNQLGFIFCDQKEQEDLIYQRIEPLKNRRGND